MKNYFYFPAFCLVLILCNGCNGAKIFGYVVGPKKKQEASAPSAAVPGTFISFSSTAYATTLALPTCDPIRESQLSYIEEESAFKVCRGGSWTNISIKGEKGDKGDAGEKGEVGSSGVATMATKIADANSDTKVETEQNTNENKIRFQTSGTERMVIDEAGKVGIGTISPIKSLEVIGATDAALLVKNTGDGFTTIAGSSDRTTAGANIFKLDGLWNGNEVASIRFRAGTDTTDKDNGAMAFLTSSDASSPLERVRITQDGKVGIGTTNPGRLLDVNDNGIRVRTAKTPSSSSETCLTGEIVWDSGYIYVCVTTNTWKRSALSAF